MGRAVLISGISLAIAIALGLAVQLDRNESVEPLAMVDSTVLPNAEDAAAPFEVGSTGSALATAAFGLSALQPETFNGQIVRDIIEASPLGYGEKDRLTAKLIAAEAGRSELPRVLADIRVSLAVE